MKKTLLLFLSLTLIAGFTMADDDEDDDYYYNDDDEGIGFSVGLDFGIDNVNKPDNRDVYLMPYVIYEKPFLDGALYLYTELDYTIGLIKDEGKIPHELSINLSLSYNLNLGESSSMSFILESGNEMVFYPDEGYKFGNRISCSLKPGILFNQNIERIGDLYAQVDAPFKYVQGMGGEGVPFGLDFTAGWKSTFGLGLKAKVHTLLAPKDVKEGYTGLDIITSYKNGPISAGVEVRLAKEGDNKSSFFDGSNIKKGIALIPSFEYAFDFGLSLYANCAFGAIGSSGDTTISPSIGVMYSF